MPILLKTVGRRNPSLPDAPLKFYPVQKTVKMIDENTVAELIAEETTLNPAEVLMAIRQLSKVLLRELMNSNSVQLGNWGSFGITLSSTGSETAELVKDTNVKRVNVRLISGTEMKQELLKAQFKWIEKKDKASDKKKE